MSLVNADGSKAVVIKDTEAEVLQAGTTTIKLIADSDTTDDLVSVNRSILDAGASGPLPHYHSGSAELFFVLGGTLQALAGDQVHMLDIGDFLLVPKNTPHAFAPPAGAEADVLILFVPAMMKRFDYFRLGERIMKGQASPEEMLKTQDRFDNHFVDSPIWREVRAIDPQTPG
jgi:quercetin dioxygenase-like cupin family protein